IFNRNGDPRTTMRKTRDEVWPLVIMRMSSNSVTPNASRRAQVTAALFSCGIMKSSIGIGMESCVENDEVFSVATCRSPRQALFSLPGMMLRCRCYSNTGLKSSLVFNDLSCYPKTGEARSTDRAAFHSIPIAKFQVQSVQEAILAGMKKYAETRAPALAIYAAPSYRRTWLDDSKDPAARATANAYIARLRMSMEKHAKASEGGVAN